MMLGFKKCMDFHFSYVLLLDIYSLLQLLHLVHQKDYKLAKYLPKLFSELH